MNILFFILLLSTLSLAAQDAEADKKEIEIVQADVLLIEEYDTVKLRRLVGSVILKQEEIYLYCDSAVFYPSRNNVWAFGNIHIEQGDTVNAYGDSLRYLGNTRLAWLKGNVRLTDKQMVLETDELYYNLESKRANYLNNGILTNENTSLSSKQGYYYTSVERAFFKDSVVLLHPKYSLYADTLEYDIVADVAIFHGPTNIDNQESKVYCEAGYYDTPNQKAVFVNKARLYNPPQTIYADSIFYDRDLGIGRAFYNVIFKDSTQNILQYCDYAEYNERQRTVLSTQNNLLVIIIEQDSLFIKGDTIRSKEDSISGLRAMKAYPNVLIYKSNLQGKCDSLYYTDEDSTIRLYHNPILWTDSTQFTADTIILEMKKNKLDKIDLYHNAFIANETDSLLYNQIKGKNIFGYFEKEELKKMVVKGNGESIYYAQDDQKAYLGINKSICSDMIIYMAARQIDKINFMTKPEASFFPIQQVDYENFILEDFRWLEDEKPKSKFDLLNKGKHTEKSQETGSTKKPSLSRSNQKLE